jgi:hypothetical protein
VLVSKLMSERPYDGTAPVRIRDFAGAGKDAAAAASTHRAAFFWKRIAGPTTVTPKCVHARRRNFWRGRVEAAMRHDRNAERLGMD